MSLTMTAGEVAQRLANDAEAVAEMLLPSGKRKSGEWVCGSVDGEQGESLSVRTRGTKAGVWKDFATGEGGDLLDLWAAARSQSISEAYRDACDYLGVKRPQFHGERQEKPRVKAPQGSKSADQDGGVMRWLTEHRQLSLESVKAYRVGAKDGAAAFPAFEPEGQRLQYIKYRSVSDKKFWSETGGAPCLFGWQAIPDTQRWVVIAEGECDAIAWHTYGFPALSPTNGAGNVQWIDAEFDHLARFDAIYLSFDMDGDGQEAVPAIIERLGAERCRVIELPAKDANDCLMDGVSQQEIMYAFGRAKTVDPEELVPASAFADDVIALFDPNRPDPGVDFPWRKGRNLFKFRPGEVTLLAGVNGHGKSELAGHLTLGAMYQSQRCCVASMEFKPAKWLRRLTRQAAALASPTSEYIRAIHGWYDDKLWVFNATGNAKADRILDVFRYAVKRYGIRWFVVDNLAKCGFAEDDYNAQKAFVDELTEFARDHDAHVVLVLHMRKREDEKKPSNKMDVKGTGAITDMADNVLTVWRNKSKEQARNDAAQIDAPFDESEEPDAILDCSKQREGDDEPTLSLWYCRESHQYLDNHDDKPWQYVEWSAIHQEQTA